MPHHRWVCCASVRRLPRRRGRRARRCQTRRMLHPGPWRRLRDGPQHQRGLPDAQRLIAAGAGLRRTSAGAGVAHGGGFYQRLQQHLQLDAGRRPRGDVVVVTVNYRLGALGFLAHPVGCRPRRRQLRPGRSAGGAALGARQHRRVRRDPDKVTIGRHRRRDVGARPPRRARLGRPLPWRHHRQRAVPGPGRTSSRPPAPAWSTRRPRAARSGGRSGLPRQPAGR